MQSVCVFPYIHSVICSAKEHGFESDENGKMVKPPNYEQLNAEMLKKMFNA